MLAWAERPPVNHWGVGDAAAHRQGGSVPPGLGAQPYATGYGTEKLLIVK